MLDTTGCMFTNYVFYLHMYGAIFDAFAWASIRSQQGSARCYRLTSGIHNNTFYDYFINRAMQMHRLNGHVNVISRLNMLICQTLLMA